MRGARFSALLLAFFALAWLVGVIPALPLFMLLYMLVERVSPVTAVAVAAGTGVATYLVFVQLLSLPWPNPAWDALSMLR